MVSNLRHRFSPIYNTTMTDQVTIYFPPCGRFQPFQSFKLFEQFKEYPLMLGGFPDQILPVPNFCRFYALWRDFYESRQEGNDQGAKKAKGKGVIVARVRDRETKGQGAVRRKG